MEPLTPDALAARLLALRAIIYAEAEGMLTLEEATELVTKVVVCDVCGFTQDIRFQPPFGWLTSGDLADGFFDQCPGCTAQRPL